MYKKHTTLIGVLVLSSLMLSAQNLKPGFDKEEYRELMRISFKTATTDSNQLKEVAEPQYFKMIYQSESMGLDNLWDLWTDDTGRAVISIRGTTLKTESWLANLYAAMIPAKGSLQLSESKSFNYNLAAHPQAAVHVGWVLSTAYLTEDMLPKIIEQYQSGIQDFLIIGHSQGGAIAYLLRSHLANLQAEGVLPNNLTFKTYCSAAPKPGNLQYAYEFETLTQGGWSFNVVNTADWVPEVPISIQTLDDFNEVNPFNDVESNMNPKKLTQKVAIKHIYRQLDNPTKKSQKSYQKYLGDMVSKYVQEQLPDFIPPEYFDSNSYVRTGIPIVLMPNNEYYTIFPTETKDFFMHHSHHAYLYLLEKL